MHGTTIAVDLAKSVFEVAISIHPGHVRERQRLSREWFRRFLAEHPAATVLMEACGSAHHWARHAQAYGHHVVLVPPSMKSPLSSPINDRVGDDSLDSHARCVLLAACVARPRLKGHGRPSIRAGHRRPDTASCVRSVATVARLWRRRPF